MTEIPSVARPSEPSAALLATHEIALTIDGGGVDAVFSCSAEAGASCRMTCPKGCELWYDDHDTDTDHALVDAGYCLVIEWLDNSAWDESYTGPPQQVRCGPIYPVWHGEGYDWSYDAPQAARSEPTPYQIATQSARSGEAGDEHV